MFNLKKHVTTRQVLQVFSTLKVVIMAQYTICLVATETEKPGKMSICKSQGKMLKMHVRHFKVKE